MACNMCCFKGYLELELVHNGQVLRRLDICPKCDDSAAFLRKLKEMREEYKDPRPLAKVIPFRKKR